MVSVLGAAVAEASRLVLFPIAAAGVGGLIEAWRRVGDAASGFIQHFAGGFVFAAAAGEVLPSLRDQHSLGAVVVGCSIGVAVLGALGTSDGAPRAALLANEEFRRRCLGPS